MCAAFDDGAVVEDDDIICVFDGLESVCDDYHGASRKEIVHGGCDRFFADTVECSGRLIEEDDFGIFDKDFGDSEALALAA